MKIETTRLLLGYVFCGVAVYLLGAEKICAKNEWVERRMIVFASTQVGFIGEDGSNEYYPQFGGEPTTRWTLCDVFPDRKSALLLSYEGYSLTGLLDRTLTTRLWRYDLSTGEKTEYALENRPAEQFSIQSSIFPDGATVLAAVNIDGGQPIYRLDLAKDEWTRLSGNEFDYGMSVSPDKKRLAFHVAFGGDAALVPAGYSVNTMNIDGSDRKLIIGESGHLFFGPTWSADGKRLAFLDCRSSEDPAHFAAALVVADTESGKVERVTPPQSHYFGTAYGHPNRRGGGSNCVCWTPLGEKLLWTKLSPGAHNDSDFRPEQGDHREDRFDPSLARGGSSLVLLDPVTGTEAPVTRPEDGRWDFRGAFSPDGEKIVYTSARVGARGELFITRLDGGDPFFLTAGFDQLGADHPRWIDICVKVGSPLAGK